MLVLNKSNFSALDNKFLFITKKKQWVEMVKETKANQIMQEEKEDSWMGGKQEGQTLSTMG
jgi:hypothetical protein